MRTQFVQSSTEAEALDACPWAVEVREVEGGYQCFESVDDARTWDNQN